MSEPKRIQRRRGKAWGVFVKPKGLRQWRWLRGWPLGSIMKTTKWGAERLARSYLYGGHGKAKAKRIVGGG
jgi:hypothetical protein